MNSKTLGGGLLAIAMVLVYWATARMSGEIDEINKAVQTHVQATASAMQTMSEASRMQSDYTASLTSLMRQICLNTSNSNEQRRECVR